MDIKLTLKSIVSQKPDTIMEQIDDDVILMSMENNEYYNLNAIASEIWNRIKEPIAIEKVCIDLQNVFEVSPKQCEKDVCGLLEVLVYKEMVDVVSQKN